MLELVFSLSLLGILGFLLLKALWRPLSRVLRLGLRAATGFLSLRILNQVSGLTGISLPLNPVTLLLSGLGGIPGTAVVCLLALL